MRNATITYARDGKFVARLDSGERVRFEQIPIRRGERVQIEDVGIFIDIYRFDAEMKGKSK